MFIINFMGPTHALSGLALYLLILAINPSLITNSVLHSTAVSVITAGGLVTAGQALGPDIDNPSSTIVNLLWPVGHILSAIVRTLSTMVYSITKTKHEPIESDPHRQLTHTIPYAIILGVLTFIATSIPGTVTIAEKQFTIGTLIGLIIILFSTQLAFAGLFSRVFKKYKNKGIIGNISILIISLVITATIFYTLPENHNFSWLAGCVVLGHLIHIFGDTITTGGTPITFPFKVKGKRWWITRFSGMKTGGFGEFIFQAIFIVTIVLSIARIAHVV